MTLTDGTVIIRQFGFHDALPLYNAVRASIPELSAYLPWCHAEYSCEESHAWVRMQDDLWENGQQYNFVITSAEGHFLGGVGLNFLDHYFCCGNLGYWIRSDAAGKGLALAAARLCLRFAFEEANFLRVEIIVDLENTRSLRVAEKLGAYREGTLRNRVPSEGRRRDAAIFSVLKEEYVPSIEPR
jgi:ribosomal-protein-serine acetyltransferase